MGVAIYDKALIDKIKGWTEKTNIHIYGPDQTSRLFKVIADETSDKPIQLPIITITRNGGYDILNPNKTTLTYNGATLISDREKSVQLNAVPISISYQIDIYTRFLEEADAYARELVFNIINSPTVQIIVPYQGINYEHNSTMKLSDEVEDNSNIQERLVPGQFTRLSLNIKIDDAYLWDTRIRNNVEISYFESGLEIHSRENDVIIEKLK